VPQGSKKNRGGATRAVGLPQAVQGHADEPANPVNSRDFGAVHAPRGRNSSIYCGKQRFFASKTQQNCAESL